MLSLAGTAMTGRYSMFILTEAAEGEALQLIANTSAAAAAARLHCTYTQSTVTKTKLKEMLLL